MRASLTLLPLALLAGCERAPEQSPGPAASPEESAPPQASIMRPDIVTKTPETAPLEPLEIAIGFPEGGSTIPDAGIARLETFLDSAQVKLGGPIELGAHSDSAGTDEVNVRASRKRGEAVMAWLVKNGIARDRITLVAFGEQNPVEPNANPDGSPNEPGRAANRRVEITVPVANAPSAEIREPTLAEEIVEKAGPESLGPPVLDKSD